MIVRLEDETPGTRRLYAEYQQEIWEHTDRMFLSANSPQFRNVVAHESGHAIMDDSYHDNFPATTNCIPHNINLASSDTCAWVEGFADWVA